MSPIADRTVFVGSVVSCKNCGMIVVDFVVVSVGTVLTVALVVVSGVIVLDCIVTCSLSSSLSTCECCQFWTYCVQFLFSIVLKFV